MGVVITTASRLVQLLEQHGRGVGGKCFCAADVPMAERDWLHPAFGKFGGVQPMYFAPHLLSMSPASTTSM